MKATAFRLTAGQAVAGLAVAGLAVAGCTGASSPQATHTLSPAQQRAQAQQRFAQRAGWLPQPIAVAPGGVAVSLIGGGGGGGGTRPKISVPPIPPASSNQPITMPLEAYQAVATQQQEALAEASNLLTQRCMAARGFTDSATASQPYTSVATLEQIETAGAGLTDAAQARTFGFVRPKGSGPRPAGLGIIGFVGVTAFGDALKVGKAYTEALYGFSPGGGPAPRGQVSCLRMATQETYGALSGEPNPDPVPQIAEQAVRFTETDPLISAANRAWSRCMARHYYHYATPGQVEGRRWPSPPTRAEIRTAKADVACKTHANLLNTWLTVEAAYQQALIAQDLAALSQLQANFAPLLKRANAALASPATIGITSRGPG
jgi:hypothetical protein